MISWQIHAGDYCSNTKDKIPFNLTLINWLSSKDKSWLESKKKPVITLDNYLRLNPLNTMLNGTKSV